MEGLTRINNVILTGQLRHPGRFALILEDLALVAWEEAKELGEVTWSEAEDLQPSILIDP